MQFTNHAAKRSKSRGISDRTIDSIMQHGDEFKCGHGCSIYRISEKELQFLKHENADEWKRLHEQPRAALVVKGCALITVMHRVKPLKRKNRLH